MVMQYTWFRYKPAQVVLVLKAQKVPGNVQRLSAMLSNINIEVCIVYIVYIDKHNDVEDTTVFHVSCFHDYIWEHVSQGKHSANISLRIILPTRCYVHPFKKFDLWYTTLLARRSCAVPHCSPVIDRNYLAR